jgi:RHS repeat-associated protein
MSTSTYTSFGKLTKEGNINSNRGYTNHQDDQASTGLIYMNARYQDPTASMFIFSDEVTKSINSKSGLLANPQSLNAYSYTWNNPINAYDPDGRLTIIVPGTWYGSDWSKTNNLFINSMNSFGEIPFVMNEKDMWSGGNVVRDRSAAAGYLSNLINNYSFKEGEKLNLVAHSHGGNVAKEAIGLLNDGIKVDNFVTLGTPVRPDYKTDMNKVNNMVEVYSYVDWTQMNGGGGFGLSSVPGYLANRGRTPFEFGFKNYFEIGPASRYEFSSGDKNKWVNATLNTQFKDPFLNTGTAHGELWSVQSIWNKVDRQLIK